MAGCRVELFVVVQVDKIVPVVQQIPPSEVSAGGRLPRDKSSAYYFGGKIQTGSGYERCGGEVNAKMRWLTREMSVCADDDRRATIVRSSW